MATSLIEKIYHRVLLFFAIFIVFCALVFTLTRALTPVFNLHLDWFEQWAGRLLDSPVKVNKIAFGWRGIEPEVWLQGVTIYSEGKRHELIHLHDLYVSLDLIKSAMHREITPSMIAISGVNASVVQQGSHFRVNDLSINAKAHPKKSTFDLESVKAWLVNQSNITLSNINIALKRDNTRLFPLHVARLKFTTLANTHQISGLVDVKQTHKPMVINFIANLDGDLTSLKKTNIHAYVDLNHVNLGDWFLKHPVYGFHVKEGLTRVKAWVNWQDGHWALSQANVDVFDLMLKSSRLSRVYNLKHLSTNLQFQPINNGWQVIADKINLITPEEIWPTTKLVVQRFHAHRVRFLQVGLGYAQLADVRAWILGTTALPKRYLNLLQSLPIHGTVNQLSVLKNLDKLGADGVTLDAKVSGLAMSKTAKYPGFNALNALIHVNQSKGQITLLPAPLQLDFGHLFSAPLSFTKAAGTVRWEHDPKNGFKVTSNDLTLINPSLALSGQVAVLQRPKNRVPMLSLTAGFSLNNPVHVKQYLPIGVMTPSAISWLSNAFISGKPMTGKVILRGPLAHFPFRHNQGIFAVSTHIDDLHLHFAPDWPDIKHIAGDVLFEDQKMIAHITSGELMGSKIQKVFVEIPDLHAPKGDELIVNSEVSSDSRMLKDFVENSPLKKTIGKGLSGIDISGPAHLKLGLVLPFKHLLDTKVDGQLTFDHNIFDFPHWYFTAKNVEGRLHFTGDSADAKQLTATIDDQPATVHVSTTRFNQDQSRVNILFNTSLDMAALKKRFDWFSKMALSGKTKLNGVLHLYLGDHNQTKQNDVALSSDLYGLKSDYPYPFNMPASLALPVSMKLQFGLHKPTTLLASLSNRINAALVFHVDQSDNAHFYSGLVRIGGGDVLPQSNPGFVLDGYIPSFNWPDWYRAVKPWLVNDGDNEQFKLSLSKMLRYVDLKFGAFNAFGFHLGKTNFKLSFADQKWYASLFSQPLYGFVSVPFDFPKNYDVSGQFQRIILPKFKSLSSSDMKTRFDPSVIPALNLTVNSLQYDHLNLGKVTLQSTPIDHGIRIHKLVTASPLLGVDITGFWQHAKDQDHSRIIGSLQSSQFTPLLNALHFQSSLLAKTALVNVDLSWPDTLYKPDIKQLKGWADLSLKNGWVVNLNKATTEKLDLGRVLTMLSVRHLLFQFSDLTHKGYSFDSLTAMLHLNQGLITTSNLKSDGSVADIAAKGSVDMNQKTLDMKLKIVVNATSSLPIIATVASGFNPIVGLATFVVDKVVHKAMSSTSSYGYLISGPWSKPKIKKV
jgi:uncharacterized protein (TIGR02099 family)